MGKGKETGAGMAAVVGRWWCKWRRRRLEKAVKTVEKRFEMKAEQMKKMVEKMVEQMEMGLKQNDCDMKMLISYFDTSRLQSVLSCENSRYIYALDFGGTNARALRVKLGNNQDMEIGDPLEEVVPLELKTKTLEDLFDFLAKIVKDLIKEEKYTDKKNKELGFCFSFPTTNTAIDAGKLTNWTKDYNIKYEEKEDLVQALGKAFQRKDLEINIRALVNDTVGTLAIGHLYDKNCIAGVIFGTGTNAAYIEDVHKIHKGKGILQVSGKMVINMEWGNFKPPKKLLTKYDLLVDNASQNKCEQIFEKMISGKYLGAIVGRVLLKLANEVELFGGKVSKTQEDKFIKLETIIVNDLHNNPDSAGQVFEVGKLCCYQSQIVARVCNLVVKRAAHLSATAIVAILTHVGKVTRKGRYVGEDPVSIAIDGSLYGKYEKFRIYLKDGLEYLLGENHKKVTLMEVKDGSGLGTAIIAACYS